MIIVCLHVGREICITNKKSFIYLPPAKRPNKKIVIMRNFMMAAIGEL